MLLSKPQDEVPQQKPSIPGTNKTEAENPAPGGFEAELELCQDSDKRDRVHFTLSQGAGGSVRSRLSVPHLVLWSWSGHRNKVHLSRHLVTTLTRNRAPHWDHAG